MDAKRAALRAEDMEHGIFTTAASLPRQEPIYKYDTWKLINHI